MKYEIRWLKALDDHGNPAKYIVGKEGVTRIEEYRAAGEGDKWYYDVVYGPGSAIHRTFQPIDLYMEVIPE